MPTTATLRWKNAGVKPALYPELARMQAVALPASVNYVAGTVLGELIGNNAVKTLSITGGPTGGYFTVSFNGLTSGAIAYNATATGTETGNGTPGTPYVTVQGALNAMFNNAVQTLTVTGATGGTFVLSYNGFQTAPIAYNASAAAVQTALQAIFGSGNVTVTGGPLNSSSCTITWSGTYGSLTLAALTVYSQQIQGGTVTCTVTNPGGPSVPVACTGGPLPGTAVTLTFQNALGYQAVGSFTANSSNLTGGSSPTASVANTTAGSAGTPGTFKAVNPNATDGSQTAKAILPVDVSTDVNGNITFSAVTNNGGEFGELQALVYVWVSGFFRTQDVPGITESMLFNDLKGRYVNGDIANGGVFQF